MRARYLAFIRDKRFLGGLLIAGFAYATFFCCLANPLLEDNTASIVGLRYPKLFFAWQVLTGAALAFNLLAMYHTYRCPKPLRTLGKGAVWTALFCQPFMYFVHGDIIDGEVVFSDATKSVHWFFSILFMVAVFASMALLFLHARGLVKRFNVLFIFVSVVVVLMLLVFFTIGKSGLFEAIPLWTVYVLLFLINCTKAFAPPEKQSDGTLP